MTADPSFFDAVLAAVPSRKLPAANAPLRRVEVHIPSPV